jgi:hypothetical protein
MGKKKNACKLLMRKPDDGSRRYRMGRGVIDWIGLAQDKDKWRTLVNVVMNFWVP